MKNNDLIGIFGPIVAFSGVLVSIFINRSWWSFTNNAISDMGRLGQPNNYVLDLSLIVGGALMFYFAISIRRNMPNIISYIGEYLFVISLFFLILIGAFPEGTYMHGIVSRAFFYLGTVALLIMGSGLIMGKEVHYGLTIVLTMIIAVILGLITLSMFSGIAIPELVGGLTISFSYYTLLWRDVQHK